MIPWVRNLGRPQLGDSFAPRVPTGITHWYSAGGCAGLDCTRWFPSQVGCLGGDGWKAGISWVLLTPAWCSQGNWSSHVAFQKPLKECSKRTKWKLQASPHPVSDSLQDHTSVTLYCLQVNKRASQESRREATQQCDPSRHGLLEDILWRLISTVEI